MTKTGAQIKSDLQIATSGSIISSPGNITTTNTAFTITGPIGKAESDTVNLLTNSITFSKQGKYQVSYTTKFGKDENADIVRTITANVYVAFDDIDIYVDMNDNVGNPVLNFKYSVNSSGDPVADGTNGASTAYLPYEMDLVTGSESIYKYTIKISKLNQDYKLAFDTSHPINISYITVEGVKIGLESGGSTGFNIGIEARYTGEIWFKADSTNMETFNTISYGSITNGFMAVVDDNSNTLLSSGIKSVHGTGIVTDDEDGVYRAQYAAKYTLDGASVPMSNFSYTLRNRAQQEVTVGNNTYYFEKWVKAATHVDEIKITTHESTHVNTVTMPTVKDYSEEADFSFVSAQNADDIDTTYIALYKLAKTDDTTVRVELKYNFMDYDTSDGNYVYNEYKTPKAESYTKTVKYTVGSGSGQTYDSFAAVQSAAATIAQAKQPIVKSNYYNYTFGGVTSTVADSDHSKITVTATLTHQPREYTIKVKQGKSIIGTHTGYYQQTKELSTSISDAVWKVKNGDDTVVVGKGSTYTARFTTSGYETADNSDCQIITVESGSTSITNTSVIANGLSEIYYDDDNGSPRAKHNFYIIDYVEEGKLLGGGVLYATTDGTNYRQSNAAEQLASVASRKNFIEAVLREDYATEYKPQTIANVGFRYKPFKDTEDVYRYSTALNAYQYIYTGDNAQNDSYAGQKLRVFSFMVYDNEGTPVVVPSEGYAEVSRIIQS